VKTPQLSFGEKIVTFFRLSATRFNQSAHPTLGSRAADDSFASFFPASRRTRHPHGDAVAAAPDATAATPRLTNDAMNHRWQARSTAEPALCRPSHVRGITEAAMDRCLQAQSTSEAAMDRILHGKSSTEPAMNRHWHVPLITEPAIGRRLQGRGTSEAAHDHSFQKTGTSEAPATHHSAFVILPFPSP
jgi:hypothetical protein